MKKNFRWFKLRKKKLNNDNFKSKTKKVSLNLNEKKLQDINFESDFEQRGNSNIQYQKTTKISENQQNKAEKNINNSKEDFKKTANKKSLLPSAISNPLQQIDSIQANLNRSKLIFQRIRVYLFLFTLMFLIMTIGVIAYVYTKHSTGKVKPLNPKKIDVNSEEALVTSWLFDKKRAPWNFSFFPIQNFNFDNPRLVKYLPAITFTPLILTNYHHVDQISILFQQRSPQSAGDSPYSNSIWNSVIGKCVVDYNTSVLISGDRTDIFQLQGPWQFGNKFLDCEVPMYLYTLEPSLPSEPKYYQINSLTFTFCSLSLLGGFVQFSYTLKISDPTRVDSTPLLMYPRIVEIDNNDNTTNLPYDLSYKIQINKDGGNDSSNSPRTIIMRPKDFNTAVADDLTQMTISLTGGTVANQVVMFIKNNDPSPQTPSNSNKIKDLQFVVDNFS